MKIYKKHCFKFILKEKKFFLLFMIIYIKKYLLFVLKKTIAQRDDINFIYKKWKCNYREKINAERKKTS